ncbi:MAG TPA: DUF5681 domain-containing protein [Rhizobiaceae bacterium]|nr:DUF5681 domain-containing protein [Rhizobiaceae bacterium]
MKRIRKHDPEGLYEVGYRKPPLATRFEKGRSGNPRGRPKGSKTARALLDRALSAPVTIIEGGEQKIVEQRAALFKSLVAKAIKGDARSIALVLKLMSELNVNEPKKDRVTHIIRTIVRPGDVRVDLVSPSLSGEDPNGQG